MNRGGGKVVGVVKMINKIARTQEQQQQQQGASGDENSRNGGGSTTTKCRFDDSDQEVLAHCVQRIADHLHIRFKELMDLVDRFSSTAKLIVSGVGGGRPERSVMDASTVTSALRRSSEGSAGMRELMAKMESASFRTNSIWNGAAGKGGVESDLNSLQLQRRDARDKYGREARKSFIIQNG